MNCVGFLRITAILVLKWRFCDIGRSEALYDVVRKMHALDLLMIGWLVAYGI